MWCTNKRTRSASQTYPTICTLHKLHNNISYFIEMDLGVPGFYFHWYCAVYGVCHGNDNWQRCVRTFLLACCSHSLSALCIIALGCQMNKNCEQLRIMSKCLLELRCVSRTIYYYNQVFYFYSPDSLFKLNHLIIGENHSSAQMKIRCGYNTRYCEVCTYTCMITKKEWQHFPTMSHVQATSCLKLDSQWWSNIHEASA